MLEHSLSSPVLCCLIISSHLLSFWAAVENILMSVRCLNVEWWKSLISQLDFSEMATTPCRLYAIDCTDAFFSLLTLKERCNRQTTLCIVTTILMNNYHWPNIFEKLYVQLFFPIALCFWTCNGQKAQLIYLRSVLGERNREETLECGFYIGR